MRSIRTVCLSYASRTQYWLKDGQPSGQYPETGCEKPKGEPNIPVTFNYSRRFAMAVISFAKDKTTRRETTSE
jgi:hypothetical protein